MKVVTDSAECLRVLANSVAPFYERRPAWRFRSGGDAVASIFDDLFL
jgi:hypothetical protein